MTKYVSQKSYRNGSESTYHTNPNCQHINENHRAVPDDHQMVHLFRECKHCSGTADYTGHAQEPCPYCGEDVNQLTDHLPCEETP